MSANTMEQFNYPRQVEEKKDAQKFSAARQFVRKYMPWILAGLAATGLLADHNRRNPSEVTPTPDASTMVQASPVPEPEFDQDGNTPGSLN